MNIVKAFTNEVGRRARNGLNNYVNYIRLVGAIPACFAAGFASAFIAKKYVDDETMAWTIDTLKTIAEDYDCEDTEESEQ